MSYEKSQLLAEKLNVDGVPAAVLFVRPDDYTYGHGDYESFTFSSSSRTYITSIGNGVNVHLGYRPKIDFIESWQEKTPASYILKIAKSDVEKLCAKVNINFSDIREEHVLKINNNKIPDYFSRSSQR